MSGSVIGLPPVLNFGSPEIKARVIPDVLSGQKLICLAISEAFAGSDVSGLKTTAKKTEDGKHWIINGTKKWITNGTLVELLKVMKYLTNVKSQFRALVSKKIFEFVAWTNKIPKLYCWLQNRGNCSVGLIILVQTNKIRQDGFTVILVERGEGVETKAIKTSYVSWPSNYYNIVLSRQ
jgi:hypothetical protein